MIRETKIVTSHNTELKSFCLLNGQKMRGRYKMAPRRTTTTGRREETVRPRCEIMLRSIPEGGGGRQEIFATFSRRERKGDAEVSQSATFATEGAKEFV